MRTATTYFFAAMACLLLIATSMSLLVPGQLQIEAARFVDPDPDLRKAPIAISGDNVYVVWFTNTTGNDEVMFRSSTDGGGTFGDKTNLSNSNNTDSEDAEIAAEGDNVVVTWWEKNQTINQPLLKVSTDNGLTFGPTLNLAANGTVGSPEEEE